MVYAGSYLAYRGPEFAHVCRVTNAGSENAARVKMLLDCLVKFPEGEGWAGHSVVVVEVRPNDE
jgi:hypothetical protein